MITEKLHEYNQFIGEEQSDSKNPSNKLNNNEISNIKQNSEPAIKCSFNDDSLNEFCENRHYYCPICFDFPSIEITKEKKFFCKTHQIELENYFEHEDELNVKDIEEKNSCKFHKDEKRKFIGFCSKCKQNLCEICIINNSRCPENNNNGHSIIEFVTLKEEIESIKKKIYNYLNMEYNKLDDSKKKRNYKQFKK